MDIHHVRCFLYALHHTIARVEKHNANPVRHTCTIFARGSLSPQHTHTLTSDIDFGHQLNSCPMTGRDFPPPPIHPLQMHQVFGGGGGGGRKGKKRDEYFISPEWRLFVINLFTRSRAGDFFADRRNPPNADGQKLGSLASIKCKFVALPLLSILRFSYSAPLFVASLVVCHSRNSPRTTKPSLFASSRPLI